MNSRDPNLSDAVDMITWYEACRQYTTKSDSVRNVENTYSDDEDSVTGHDSDSENSFSDLRGVNGRKWLQRTV